MKDISTDLNNHLSGGVTSLASCWQITRTDGISLYFTDHDQDLKIEDQTYLASEGYDRSALKNTSGLDTDEMDLLGNLNSDQLSEEDLRVGKFDFAEILFFLVNWQDRAQGILPLRKGWIGEVSWEDGRFSAELRGLSNAFKKEISHLYTPECLVDLGDAKCKIDLEALAATDIIGTVPDLRTIILTSFNGEDGVLDGGILHFTSGANTGRKVEIQSWVKAGKTLTLFLDLPFPASVGDIVKIYLGCDKRFATCRDVFSNQTNFRGFPHIPGTDSLLEVANG